MQKKEAESLYRVLSERSRIKWNIALKSIFVGVAAGLLVVLYRIGIEYGSEHALRMYAYLRLHPVMVFPWLGVILVVGLGMASLIKYEPMATGSGIPQVEGVLRYGLRIRWYSVLLVRYTAGILASFFGLSLGREGPSIQIGAAGGQAVAKRISRNKLEENYLITGGAAAGLSAAFNAPLSGIVFALEEVHRSFSGLVLIAATTAALTADVVAKYFFGLKPVLHFMATPSFPEYYYLWLIPIGVASGVVGALVNKSLLGVQRLYQKVPARWRPCIALLIALPCGLLLPAVLGGGQNLVEIAESTHNGVWFIALLLVVKFLFTCTSFGSGVPGGIFLPILAIGALTGSLVGHVAVQFGMPEMYLADFAVFSMAGALSGAVKAPVTSILLIAEMTGSLVHMFPVAACSFMALFLSDVLKTVPIYEALLGRILENHQDIQNNKLGGVVEVAVEMGSQADGKKVRDIEWPSGTLLVGIRRGDDDIVPNGGTRVLAGDYLMIMSSERSYRVLNAHVRALCHFKQT